MPSFVDLLLDPVSLTIFAGYGLLLAWEALAPARRLPVVPYATLRSGLSFVLYFFVSSYLPVTVAGSFAGLRLCDGSGLGTVGGALAALFVYEALGYGWHRLMHRSNTLFRFVHQLHHSAERLDAASAFYFGPLDMVGWTLVSTVALTIVGFTPGATALFLLMSTLNAIFQHMNVRTPRWLGYLVQRPESHALHHARGYHRNNYAGLPIYDLLFGTFENPAEFVPCTGYYDGASARVLDMLLCRDVSAPGARASVRRSADGSGRASSAPCVETSG